MSAGNNINMAKKDMRRDKRVSPASASERRAKYDEAESIAVSVLGMPLEEQ